MREQEIYRKIHAYQPATVRICSDCTCKKSLVICHCRKKTPEVFLAKKDICYQNGKNKVAVKQGVLYVRVADTTQGAETEIASATEHIRIWKKYIDWLELNKSGDMCDEENNHDKT